MLGLQLLLFVKGYTGGDLDNVPPNAHNALKWMVETVQVHLRHTKLTLEEAIEAEGPTH